MADNDVQTDLKKRARRRLVGAVALALLAAIVLPMVMAPVPEHSSGGETLNIRIPSREGGNTASRLITGTAPPPVTPVLPTQSAPSVVAAPAPSEMSAEAQSAPQSSVSASVQAPAVPEVTQSAALKAEKARADEMRARALLEGKPVPVAGKFYVQIGVYREEKNAREQSARAAAQGVKVVLEKLSDGATRVRSGPYVERAAADRVLEKMKKAGIEARVVSSK